MSYPTIPAYQTTATGPAQLSSEHPVLNFLNTHQEAFDNGNMKNEPYTVFQTNDFVFTKSDGTVFPPGEASWKGWLEEYAPFSQHFHETRYACIYELNGVWEMVGFANVYVNLLVPGEKTKTDASGRQWDVFVQGAFLFKCVKDPAGPTGFKLKSATVFGDRVPVVAEMLKRGMIKPEDLSK